MVYVGMGPVSLMTRDPFLNSPCNPITLNAKLSPVGQLFSRSRPSCSWQRSWWRSQDLQLFTWAPGLMFRVAVHKGVRNMKKGAVGQL